MLARVDVVCLDKTGTLTEGTIEYDAVEPLGSDAPADDALGALAADPNRNATADRTRGGVPRAGRVGTATATMPFSSARKWSGATFATQGTWILGAPEMVWVDKPAADPVRRRADELAADGRRVLLLAHTDAPFSGEELPDGLEAVGARPVQGEGARRRGRDARVLHSSKVSRSR